MARKHIFFQPADVSRAVEGLKLASAAVDRFTRAIARGRNGKENLEIRVLSTGKGWRVDRKEVGAASTRTVHRSVAREGAVTFARGLALLEQQSGEVAKVRLMIEELF